MQAGSHWQHAGGQLLAACMWAVGAGRPLAACKPVAPQGRVSSMRVDGPIRVTVANMQAGGYQHHIFGGTGVAVFVVKAGANNGLVRISVSIEVRTLECD